MAVTVPFMECVLLRFRSLYRHRKYILSTCSDPVGSVSFSQISLMSLLPGVPTVNLIMSPVFYPKYATCRLLFKLRSMSIVTLLDDEYSCRVTSTYESFRYPSVYFFSSLSNRLVISLSQISLKSGPLSGLIHIYGANQAYIACYEVL
jgi:hypothetical protein